MGDAQKDVVLMINGGIYITLFARLSNEKKYERNEILYIPQSVSLKHTHPSTSLDKHKETRKPICYYIYITS